jgi:hypothetical protein
MEDPMPTLLPTAGRRRLAAAAALLALVAAACGGSATAAPTASPTLAPTATPFDVAAAFVAIVGDPDFSARMEVDGTMEMGVSATLTGTITGSGDDSRTLLKVGLSGQTLETETITSGGKSYSRSGAGPWLEEPAKPAAEDTSLTTWLRTLDEFEDLGVVTKNGKKLHHLSAGDAPVPPAAIGLDASTFKDPVVTIDFYATDDGTPAVFSIEGTWVQLINGSDFTVEFLMDLTLSNVGSAITIDPPSDVWTTYTSPLGYSMAHPDSFSVENRDGYDAFVLNGEDWIYVQPWPDAAGLSPEGFRDALLEFVKDSWGDPVVAPVATSLGGEPGFIATFHYTYDDGTEGIAIDVLAMHKNQGHEVTFFTVPGQENADAALFDKFLATFEFAD